MRLKVPGQAPPSAAGERYRPLDPTLPVVQAHRPLALAILADYGNPTTGELRVSAIIDWIARTAIHSHYGLRLPTPYTRGMGALPAGVTWADVQATWTAQKQNDDNAYWSAFNHDAKVILDKLLGTLDIATGVRAADGTMSLVAGSGQAHYRYNSLAAIKSVWCTHQHNIATLLLASLGYPAMLCHITGHDPLRVQYGDSGEWGYWCSTYNEHYRQTGKAAPIDLLTMRDLTQAGQQGQIVRVTHAGPGWDTTQYVSASYLVDHPEGVPQCGVSLDSRITPGGIGSRTTRALDDPALATSGNALANYTRTAERTAKPYLGAYVYGVPVRGTGMTAVRVASGWPGTTGFQTRTQAGNWTAITATTLPNANRLTTTVRVRDGVGLVEVAPVDANGQRGPAVQIVG